MKAAITCLLGLIFLSPCVVAQLIPVPNSDFDEGLDAPLSWSLSALPGGYHREAGADGHTYVSVEGSGTSHNHWISAPLPFEAGALYTVEFDVRGIDTAGGTPVTGPVFCNRDIRVAPPEWTTVSSVFSTPEDLTPDEKRLRFGQWHLSGAVCYDSIRLRRVQPLHAEAGGLTLGEGERLSGTRYQFQAPFRSDSRNYSRPLEENRCRFNTDRWVFGADSRVVYRHRLAGRRLTAANVSAAVTWYRGGQLAVSVSRDGETWRDVGTQGELGSVEAAIPAALLPANEIWVKLEARASRRVDAADSDPGSFQVGNYAFSADVDGAPVDMTGSTRFVRTVEAHPQIDVQVLSVGDGLPGSRNNLLKVRLTNRTAKARAVGWHLTARQTDGEGAKTFSAKPMLRLSPGPTDTTFKYDLPSPGSWTLGLGLADDGGRSVTEIDLFVPDYYDTSYGELLGTSPGVAALWWANAARKVPPVRALPTRRGMALRLRAAGNEREAAQLVIRPVVDLSDVTISATDLNGPGNAVLPHGQVELFRVRYVDVTQATDGTGVAAPWPDPLPPLTAPLDLAAGINQPIWVRVHVPAGTPPGEYRGRIELTRRGVPQMSCPVQLQVYGFDLPDRMSCQTAFGFSPATAFRYHGITDAAQKRDLLELYWQSFSDHHISPYDPAPLDPCGLAWTGAPAWQGGARDREAPRQGEASLKVADTSTTSQASARYDKAIAIPEAGLRLRFDYRTAEPGHAFIVTLNHSDAAGDWMSGRNNDMRLTGTGAWQSFDRPITRFPNGAATVRLTLWASLYADSGEPTGTVWYDNVKLTDAGTGEDLVSDGRFEPLVPADLRPVFSWDAWDRATARAVDHYHFNTFRLRIQGLGGGTFHARSEPNLLGYPEDSPEYQSAMGAYLQGLQAHLETKGWLDEAFVYWFDEPDPKDYEFVSNGFRKLRTHAPEIRRMLTEQVEEELLGGPTIWCPVSHNYDLEDAKPREAQGEEFWWYVCTGPKAPYCTLFIDHPGTEMRVWLWQTWKRGIRGILVWQTNYWSSSAAYPDAASPQNPYEDPMGWVSGYSTPAGTKRAWGNGDGRFIYPPEQCADGNPKTPVLAAPVDSIRWEMLRDGIEDYEYFAILKRLLETRGERLSAAERARLEHLLQVPDSVSASATEFTTDPRPLESHRQALATAIETLLR